MMLHVDDIHVHYGASVHAVQGLSLRVDEGELVSIIGQNGAGKSTVLKAVMGVVPVASGSIHFDGVPVGSSGFSSVKQRMSYVPESRGIFAGLTVGENLRLGATSRKDRRGIEADIERELERFPVLKKYWDRGASLLSGGEQQQLAIARALMLRPKLLVLDEPTLGLAPIIVDLIFDVVEQLRGEGMTILLVEQNARKALAISDYAYVMETGRIALEGTGAELAGNDAVTAAYLGRREAGDETM